MTKKTYIHPVMTVVRLQHPSALLTISNTEVQGLDNLDDLILDENGETPGNAW
jgi:hypothetical protein